MKALSQNGNNKPVGVLNKMINLNPRNGIRRYRVFARLLIPYLAFLLLAIIIGAAIYEKTIALIDSQVTTNQIRVLEQSKEILERRLEELSSISLQLANDTRIIQLQAVTDPFAGKNTYRVLDTNKNLYDYKLYNNFIYNYYIFFKNSKLVLTPGGVYPIDQFFGNIAQFSKPDLDQWMKLISGAYVSHKMLPAQKVTMKDAAHTMLTYIQSLGSPGTTQGMIAIMIDQKQIQALFQGLGIADNGWAYIMDEQGQIVSTLSSNAPPLEVELGSLQKDTGFIKQSLPSGEVMIAYTKSFYNGWIYVVGQPASIVLEKVRYIQKIMFVSALIFLGLGIFIAYILAYRNSKPLRNLLYNNDKLKAEIEQQVPLLRAAYLQRLLSGQFDTIGDSEALFKHIGMTWQGRSCRVVLVQLRGFVNSLAGDLPEEPDAKRVLAKEILREIIEPEGFVCDIAEDQFAVLLGHSAEQPESEPDRQAIEWKLQSAKESMNTQLKLIAVFGIGAPCGSLAEISRSYEQAREALNMLLWKGEYDYAWFEELPTDRNNYYFPQDTETRLIHMAKAGDSAQVALTLDTLYEENFERRHLPLAAIHLFLSDMWGSLMKLLPQIELDQQEVYQRIRALSSETDSHKSRLRSYQAIRSTYLWACDRVNEHKKSQNVQLVASILEMLQNTYHHSELCLDAVADRFGITKVYLSQFFKEQLGINFSEYLENLRMDKAKKLLQSTPLTIQEIAEHVGYSSSNTFCRAFKRLHGISATSYKKM